MSGIVGGINLRSSGLVNSSSATDGQVLTGTGVGLPAGFEAAGGGGLESSTVAVFFQSGAPTDWTKSTANNDKMLRVVSGTGGGTGGTSATSSPAHSLSAGAHTLATGEMPSHTHGINGYTSSGSQGFIGSSWSTGSGRTSTATGGGGTHSHSLSGSITTPAYMDVIIATKD